MLRPLPKRSPTSQPRKDMLGAIRRDVFAFLSAPAGECVPASGQIVGILEQMKDEMGGDFSEAKAAEEEAIEVYTAMMIAKKHEVAASQRPIDEKLQRVADLGVEIAEMENDLGDSSKALAGKKALKTPLEMAALADTLNILNDDDALELFTKTLQSASASSMQMAVSMVSMRASALSPSGSPGLDLDKSKLDFISLAIQGKKVGFEKVIQIDEMVVTLKKGAGR